MTAPQCEGVRWLCQARADLAAAEHLIASKDYNVACFMAQQSAEKAIKGYLRAGGEVTAYGNSVGLLCKWAGEFNPQFRELEDKVGILDTFYIPTRYPDALPDIIPAQAYTEALAANAVSVARRVVDTVAGLLEGTPGK